MVRDPRIRQVGDMHANNIMKDERGNFWMIDWDDTWLDECPCKKEGGKCILMETLCQYWKKLTGSRGNEIAFESALLDFSYKGIKKFMGYFENPNTVETVISDADKLASIITTTSMWCPNCRDVCEPEWVVSKLNGHKKKSKYCTNKKCLRSKEPSVLVELSALKDSGDSDSDSSSGWSDSSEGGELVTETPAANASSLPEEEVHLSLLEEKRCDCSEYVESCISKLPPRDENGFEIWEVKRQQRKGKVERRRRQGDRRRRLVSMEKLLEMCE